MQTWALPEKIIELSVADSWYEAKNEWSLDGIEMLDRGEFDECLCGHYPIRELCHIHNEENGERATVGNRCIERFNAENPESEVFQSVPKMSKAAKKISNNSSASANPALIDFAKRVGIFSDKDAKFYHDIWRKKSSLSPKQTAYKLSLNQHLLYRHILSVRAAYQRLKSNSRAGTAGPKLIEHAFKKGVLRERDKEFYMQNWNRAHHKLSERQRSYKENLNKKILFNLSAEFDQ